MYDAQEEIQNEESGRLDARRIAQLYNLTLPQFCKATGLNYEAVRKTPDASPLQEILRRLWSIYDTAKEALGEDPVAVRNWLHRPNRALARERPIDLLSPSRIDELEDVVNRMRTAEYS
ncbi:MAG: antitoxin Xre/MbcA/ParS toxin-binding domain-containing protein [Vulcanimicrobiaceae bacterium]